MKFSKAKDIAKKKNDKAQLEALEYLEQASNENEQEASEYLRNRNNQIAKNKEEELRKNINELGSFDKKMDYCTFLAMFTNSELDRLGIDKDWFVKAVATNEEGISLFGQRFKTEYGIIVALKDPRGGVYVEAMKASGNPDLDLDMAMRFVLNAEATFESYNKTKDFLNSKVN